MLDTEILSPVPRRNRSDQTDALRRMFDTADIPYARAASQDDQRMDTQPRSADAVQAGPDYVNHPPHYTAHPSGVECITITRHMNFNKGNAMKYIWRAGDKGNEIEDLKKAAWYIADEIARLEKLRDGESS